MCEIKRSCDFIIHFCVSNEANLEFRNSVTDDSFRELESVSKQITQIKLPKNDFSGWANNGENVIYFEYSDAIDNVASKKLLSVGEKCLPFDMIVNVTDNKKTIIESIVFHGCTIQDVERLTDFHVNSNLAIIKLVSVKFQKRKDFFK